MQCDYAKYYPVCLALALRPAAVCDPSPPLFNGMFSQDLGQLFSLNAFGTCGIDQPDSPVSSRELLFFQHTFVLFFKYCTDTMQHMILFQLDLMIVSICFIYLFSYCQFKRMMYQRKYK